jgi:hypothetical protein
MTHGSYDYYTVFSRAGGGDWGQTQVVGFKRAAHIVDRAPMRERISAHGVTPCHAQSRRVDVHACEETIRFTDRVGTRPKIVCLPQTPTCRS